MEYIKAVHGEAGANPFTLLPKMENDRESLIVWRGEHVYLVLNRFPYSGGHMMAVPFREVSELDELKPEERTELMDSLVLAKRLLRKVLRPDGFNIGFNFGKAAGAGIPEHLHGHIVPRWDGDHNFMPVLSDTRVLPQALEEMWETLRNHVPECLAEAGREAASQ